MKHGCTADPKASVPVNSKLRVLAIIVGALCVPVSGILGWVLLVAAAGGVGWAQLGLAYSAVTAAAVGWFFGITNETKEHE